MTALRYAPPAPRPRVPGSRWPSWLRPVYLLIAAWIVGVFAPYTWMFITSITPPSEMAAGSLLPADPTFDAYVDLLTTTPFFQYVANSLMVAVGTVLITISSALLAGTALSRYRFRGRQAVLQGLNAQPQAAVVSATRGGGHQALPGWGSTNGKQHARNWE